MNQQYYILAKACGSNETGGAYPQSDSMIDNYQFNAPNSYRKMVHDKFPDFVPNLNAFKINKKAKITDVISVGSIYFGLLVNLRMRDLLLKFNLLECRFYNSYIEYRNQISNNYYFFHSPFTLASSIDYSKTEFYLWDKNDYREKVKINSENELLHFKRNNNINPLWILRTDKYLFKSNDFRFDLFQSTFNDQNIYISHRLKTALEEAHITGIEIVPTDVI